MSPPIPVRFGRGRYLSGRGRYRSERPSSRQDAPHVAEVRGGRWEAGASSRFPVTLGKIEREETLADTPPASTPRR